MVPEIAQARLSSASNPAKGARPQNTELSALFCWQHKDQAASCAVEASKQNDSIQQIQRSSMDTVMDRLGILDIDDSQGRTKPERGGPASSASDIGLANSVRSSEVVWGERLGGTQERRVCVCEESRFLCKDGGCAADILLL